MSIATRFDIGDRVCHSALRHPGRVVSIHKDRAGRVRLDVEWRDRRGAVRSEWFNEDDLEPVS